MNINQTDQDDNEKNKNSISTTEENSPDGYLVDELERQNKRDKNRPIEQLDQSVTRLCEKFNLTTQFVPAGSRSTSTSLLRTTKSLLTSDRGIESTIRLIQSTLRIYIYLRLKLVKASRNSHSSLNIRSLRSVKLSVSLSLISLTKNLIDLIRTVSENQTILKYLRSLPRLKRRFRTKQKDKEDFLEDSGGGSDGSSETVKRSLVVPRLMVTEVNFEDERKNFSEELDGIKGLIQTIGRIGQTAVDLLDDLSNLTVISPSLNRSLERWMMVGDCLSLLNCLTGYAITSFDRADVWRLGRRTRLEMIQRQSLVREFKARGNLKLSIGPPLDCIEDWFGMGEDQRRRVESVVYKTRNSVLKECKRTLNRIWWIRLGLIYDGVFSVYDLLNFKYRFKPIRILMNLLTTILNFQEEVSKIAQNR